MPKFEFMTPDGLIRSRSTKTREPGYTHAVMEFHPFKDQWTVSGWQLACVLTSETDANDRVARIIMARPDAKLVVVPRVKVASDIPVIWSGHMDGDAAHLRFHLDQVYFQVSGGNIHIGCQRESLVALHDVITVMLQPKNT